MDSRQSVRPISSRPAANLPDDGMKDPLQGASPSAPSHAAYSTDAPEPTYGGLMGPSAPMYHSRAEHSIDLSDHADVLPPRTWENSSVHSRTPLHRPTVDAYDYVNLSRVQIDPTHNSQPDNMRPPLSEKVPQNMYGGAQPPMSPPRFGMGAPPNGPLPNQDVVTPMTFANGNGNPGEATKSRTCATYFRSSIVFRWIVFITPFMLLIWIPGVIGIFFVTNAQVWGVKLMWWSAWLSMWWGSWWIGLAAARLLPPFLHNTLGAVAQGMNKWFAYLSGMTKAVTIFTWALLSFITFNVFIIRNQPPNQTKDSGSGQVLHLMVQFLFGVLLASVGLMLEKLLIQMIASSFHKRSYEDRIIQQEAMIQALVTLYDNSHDIGRSDTLDRANAKPLKDPARLLKSALKGVRNVAQAGTTVVGTVASEIAGQRILQPNSPECMVLTALESSNKSRHLARRIYFSFVPRGRKELVISDISRFFPNIEAAQEAFKVLDRDENGDASLEEIEMSCLDLHRDRLALEASMSDLDSAVGRLDDILIFLFWIIALLIIIALMDVSFQTMLASAGTLILGLSWLIGATAQEILASILFLFVKHPYDVADRVDIDGQSYIVKEISLLYTVFRQTDGKIAQMPHSALSTKTVINIRRSGAISETFEFNVDFGTTFEQIEALRSQMIRFVELEKRDFFPHVDISVKNFTSQSMLTLTCDINYKSNWQNGGLQAQRRNKWLCGLKLALADVRIFGPAGAGNPTPELPPPTLIKLVDSTPPSPAHGQHDHIPAAAPPRRSTADIVDHLAFAGRDEALRDGASDILDQSETNSLSHEGGSNYSTMSRPRQSQRPESHRPHRPDSQRPHSRRPDRASRQEVLRSP